MIPWLEIHRCLSRINKRQERGKGRTASSLCEEIICKYLPLLLVHSLGLSGVKFDRIKRSIMTFSELLICYHRVKTIGIFWKIWKTFKNIFPFAKIALNKSYKRILNCIISNCKRKNGNSGLFLSLFSPKEKACSQGWPILSLSLTIRILNSTITIAIVIFKPPRVDR